MSDPADQRGQPLQAGEVLLRHEHLEVVTDERREQHRPQLAVDAGHVPPALAADDDQGALGCRARRRRETDELPAMSITMS